jgi:5-methylcytosine-specific restriction protein A
MSRADPFHHEPRRRLSPQERAKIFADHEGKCAKCTRPLRARDRWDADHILALENGGTNDLSNFRPLCEWCHGSKTADDHAQAGHNRRTYTKHYVPSEFRRSKSWGRR